MKQRNPWNWDNTDAPPVVAAPEALPDTVASLDTPVDALVDVADNATQDAPMVATPAKGVPRKKTGKMKSDE